MTKKIIFLISIIFSLLSCSNKINNINDFLYSKPIQKELMILQEIETNLEKNLNNKEQEKFLLKISNEFKSIKSELKSMKTDNNKIQKAIETQIMLCEVYVQIENEIKSNGVETSRKFLKEAEEYYQEFIKIIED